MIGSDPPSILLAQSLIETKVGMPPLLLLLLCGDGHLKLT